MRDYKEFLISANANLKDALAQLNLLALDAILFVIDEHSRLVGSLTDGDIRRGLLKGKGVDDNVMDYIQPSPRSVSKVNYSLTEIVALREKNFKVLPVLDADKRVVNVINFRTQKSYLPIDALVMAGGRGSRLRPLTDTIPKPLLKVGEKAIIDHNIDRLRSFGIDDFHISVRYLGEQIEEHYHNRRLTGVNFKFVWEKEPLGTLGAASLIKEFHHDYVLVTNSDLLTTLDYEDFFLNFLETEADMAVASIPYKVDVPYAVLETNKDRVASFKEKPTYTYQSNGGIYIMRKEFLEKIPFNKFYNATDLMEKLINDGNKLITYPIHQYWLDIGKPDDFTKAQEDIKRIDL
jgi:dTDP-glucose pyrophosphorylase